MDFPSCSFVIFVVKDLTRAVRSENPKAGHVFVQFISLPENRGFHAFSKPHPLITGGNWGSLPLRTHCPDLNPKRAE
jgi:hypothetical protein